MYKRQEQELVHTPVGRRTRASRLIESQKRQRESEPMLTTPGAPARTRLRLVQTAPIGTRKRGHESDNASGSPPRRILKQSTTKYKREWTCDRWENDKVFCKFCNLELHVNPESGRSKAHSHLLYACSGIPGLGPLPKNVNFRKKPTGIHRRLSEIAAVFDPGGP